MGRKYKEDDRTYWKEWYAKNRERLLKKSTEWRLKNKERYNANQNDYRHRYPEKKNAHKLSFRNIKMPVNQLCQKCKKKPAIQKHHPNYRSPLNIKFVCIPCHNQIHIKEKDKEYFR